MHLDFRLAYLIQNLEFIVIAPVYYDDTCIIDDLEWPILHVILHYRVVKTSTNETFGVVDGICGIHRHDTLCSFTNVPLISLKHHTRRCGSITRIIGYDFHLAIAKNSNAGVGGAQINTNSWRF